MFRVAVLDDYQQAAAELADWGSLGDDVDVVFFHDHAPTPDQLVRRLRGFDATVAMRERTAFPRDVLARLPGLRLLVTTGMVNASIDIAAANELGITVTGTGGRAGADATIELTWALIFALARGVPAEDAAIRHGGWQVGIGQVLHGKTLGIVGLGNLGARMPPVARALGMRVIGWSRNLTAQRAAEVGVEFVSQYELFSTSDVVTVHIKLSDRSRGYVGRDELRSMKPTALLVNTSRGPVIELAALIEALELRWIAGAALDVFDIEPLPPDHPLRHLPRTVLTPHIGYVSVEAYRSYYGDAVEDIAAFRSGSPVRVLRPD
jgi:phosphoglycerate dehydrogenase-like enzyme